MKIKLVVLTMTMATLVIRGRVDSEPEVVEAAGSAIIKNETGMVASAATAQ